MKRAPPNFYRSANRATLIYNFPASRLNGREKCFIRRGGRRTFRNLIPDPPQAAEPLKQPGCPSTAPAIGIRVRPQGSAAQNREVGDLKAISVVGACTIGPLLLTYLLIAARHAKRLSDSPPRQAARKASLLVAGRSRGAPRGSGAHARYMMDGTSRARRHARNYVYSHAGSRAVPASPRSGLPARWVAVRNRQLANRFPSASEVCWPRESTQTDGGHAIVRAWPNGGEREIGRCSP